MVIDIDVAEKEAYELLEKGIGELVFRDKNKRFNRMIKFNVLDSDKISNNQKDELLKQIRYMVNKNDYNVKDVRKALNVADKKMAMGLDAVKDMAVNIDSISNKMENLSNIASLGVGLDLVNIAVSVAGFAIMANKLNKLNEEVNAISNKINQVSDVQKNEKIDECQKLIMRFNSITDKVRNKSELSIDTIEDLVIDMRGFISEMVKNFNDRALSSEIILGIINTLLPAYTILVCEYLDRYYFANESTPANYEMSVSLFDELLTNQFMEKLEDYFLFDNELSHRDMTDAVNTQTLMILNLKLQIEDQLRIMKELKAEKNIINYRESIEASINQFIEELIPELSEKTGIDEQTCREVLLTN